MCTKSSRVFHLELITYCEENPYISLQLIQPVHIPQYQPETNRKQRIICLIILLSISFSLIRDIPEWIPVVKLKNKNQERKIQWKGLPSHLSVWPLVPLEQNGTSISQESYLPEGLHRCAHRRSFSLNKNQVKSSTNLYLSLKTIF